MWLFDIPAHKLYNNSVYENQCERVLGLNIKKERLQATMKMLKKILEELDSIDPEDFVPTGNVSCLSSDTVRVVGELGDEQKKLLILLDQTAVRVAELAPSFVNGDSAVYNKIHELMSLTKVLASLIEHSLREASNVWDLQKTVRAHGESIVTCKSALACIAYALDEVMNEPLVPDLSNLGNGGDPARN